MHFRKTIKYFEECPQGYATKATINKNVIACFFNAEAFVCSRQDSQNRILKSATAKKEAKSQHKMT